MWNSCIVSAIGPIQALLWPAYFRAFDLENSLSLWGHGPDKVLLALQSSGWKGSGVRVVLAIEGIVGHWFGKSPWQDMSEKDQESISSTFYAKLLHMQIPKSAKRYWQLDWICMRLGSAGVNTPHKHVGEIDHRVGSFVTSQFFSTSKSVLPSLFFCLRTRCPECKIFGGTHS